jgi:hypothetical protein
VNPHGRWGRLRVGPAVAAATPTLVPALPFAYKAALSVAPWGFDEETG